jgi:hypothetical protein
MPTANLIQTIGVFGQINVSRTFGGSSNADSHTWYSGQDYVHSLTFSFAEPMFITHIELDASTESSHTSTRPSRFECVLDSVAPTSSFTLLGSNHSNRGGYPIVWPSPGTASAASSQTSYYGAPTTSSPPVTTSLYPTLGPLGEIADVRNGVRIGPSSLASSVASVGSPTKASPMPKKVPAATSYLCQRSLTLVFASSNSYSTLCSVRLFGHSVDVVSQAVGTMSSVLG